MKSPFLDACSLKPVERIPIWFMRQAGRSIPEYQKIKGSKNMLDVSLDPETAATITLLPEKYYDIDALVLFSDITIGFVKAQLNMKLVSNLGPVFFGDFDFNKETLQLKSLKKSDFKEISQTIKIVKKKSSLPLIGFVGGPFTLACYLIERQAKKNWLKTRRYLYENPKAFADLINVLTDLSQLLIEVQIQAGVDAIQIFDSWAGILSSEQFLTFCQEPLKKIADLTNKSGCPGIYFSLDNYHLLPLIKQTQFSVLSLDWKVSLLKARELLGSDIALQGNLDPLICLGSFDLIEYHAKKILDEMASMPGFIFNLGHGVLPETPYKNLAKLCNFVHNYPEKKNNNL
jgi:uroporphyrinogen decarboxylase